MVTRTPIKYFNWINLTLQRGGSKSDSGQATGGGVMDVTLSPRPLWEPQKSREPAGAQSKKAQRMTMLGLMRD